MNRKIRNGQLAVHGKKRWLVDVSGRGRIFHSDDAWRQNCEASDRVAVDNSSRVGFGIGKQADGTKERQREREHDDGVVVVATG